MSDFISNKSLDYQLQHHPVMESLIITLLDANNETLGPDALQSEKAYLDDFRGIEKDGVYSGCCYAARFMYPNKLTLLYRKNEASSDPAEIQITLTDNKVTISKHSDDEKISITYNETKQALTSEEKNQVRQIFGYPVVKAEKLGV